MAKHIARFVAVLSLCGFLIAPGFLAAQERAASAPSDEEIVLTVLPENHLNLGTFSTGLEGLDENSRAAVVPVLPTPGLAVQKHFWNWAESSLFTASLISFSGLNVADYFLTREAMKHPEAGETNPLIRPIVKNAAYFALFKVGYIALNTIGLRSLHQSDKPMAWALSLATNILVTLAVTHNITELNKIKNR